MSMPERVSQPDELQPEESGIIPTPQRAISRPLAAAPTGEDAPLQSGFISEQRLADLLFRRCVTRVGPGVIAASGARYAIHEAVKVLGRVDGQSDPYGLAGAVESMAALTRAGGHLSGRTLTLGSASYRVERGVIAVARDAPRPYDPFELLSV